MFEFVLKHMSKFPEHVLNLLKVQGPDDTTVSCYKILKSNETSDFLGKDSEIRPHQKYGTQLVKWFSRQIASQESFLQALRPEVEFLATMSTLCKHVSSLIYQLSGNGGISGKLASRLIAKLCIQRETLPQ